MTQHSQMTADDDRESRRVAMIFGALTLLTVLPFGSIIAVLLTVTTGQGAGTTVVGLAVAAAVACACAALVAQQTRVQHRLSAAPVATVS